MNTDTTEWDAKFIAEHAWREDVTERFKAGLLPRSELLELVTEVAFRPGQDLDRFYRLLDDDIKHHPDVGPHRACFTSRGLTAVTASQWAVLKTISELFPGGVVKPKRHMARCPFCEASAVSYGAVVVLQYGPYQLRHEYELPKG